MVCVDGDCECGHARLVKELHFRFNIQRRAAAGDAKSLVFLTNDNSGGTLVLS